MTCESCGKPAPLYGTHDTYHFTGEREKRFYVCGDVCWWVVQMRRVREEAAR